MTTTEQDEHEAFSQQHRGGVFFEKLGIDLYPHPYLGFALAPGHRSAVINTDEAGFRMSGSPSGPVGAGSWLAGGGGSLLVGSSVAFGLAASNDDATVASQLATLTGEPWLNLGVLAANSLQELIAAVPFLHAADTVVVFSGLGNYLSMLRTRTPEQLFGPVFYEGTFARLTQVPLFDLAAWAGGEPVAVPPGGWPMAEPPPEGDLSDAADRTATAARLQLRDLGFLARSARPGTRAVRHAAAGHAPDPADPARGAGRLRLPRAHPRHPVRRARGQLRPLRRADRERLRGAGGGVPGGGGRSAERAVVRDQRGADRPRQPPGGRAHPRCAERRVGATVPEAVAPIRRHGVRLSGPR
jgi:hypothetical protein